VLNDVCKGTITGIPGRDGRQAHLTEPDQHLHPMNRVTLKVTFWWSATASRSSSP
jgi:hypothetical protein